MYAGPASDPNIYVFGGSKSQLNRTFYNSVPDPSTYSLWAFDTNGQAWNQFDVTGAVPLRPSRGGYTEAPDQGLAFSYGGQADNGSSTQTSGMGSTITGTQGLVMLNLTSEAGPQAQNMSSPDSGTAVTSPELVYIPQIGQKGILVEMGGSSLSTTDFIDTNGTLVSFESVNILDVASVYSGVAAWSTQATTGDIPPPRIDTCTVMAAAPDNSSYNMLVEPSI
jgi:hypothetical protein